MPENEKSSDEKLLILPLGEESKKITQVISNDTARQIIEILADSPLSASDIAERLHTPLTTITYNLENLEKVGLVRIERIRYSEKGREVKIFAPVRKLIVVVPEKTDKKSAADIIRKYIGVIFAGVLASGLIEFVMRYGGNTKTMQDQAPLPAIERLQNVTIPSATGTPSALLNETIKGAGDAVSSPAVPTPALPVPESSDILSRITDIIIAHPGLVFLLGCLFIVGLLIINDLRRRKNSQ